MNKIVLHNPSNEAPKPNNKTIKFVSVNPSPKGDKIYLKKEQKDDFVNHVVQSNPTQEKQDRQQHFWHETQTEKRIKNDPSTSECTPVRQMTCLQKRLLQASTRTAGPSFKELPSDWKAYFLLTAISEHEQDQGGGEDGGLEASMVGGSYWTTYEKNRFFVALDRCGRHCVHDIAKRVGPTKTIQEVAVYLNILDQLAKVSPKEQNAKLDPCAREMSPMFIMQEEQMASKLVKHLETESYKKHLELVSSKQYEYTEQLFDLRNMSSLTKLSSSADDMTVLISSLVQYHQLVRDFVRDIITTLYTEMTNEKDKTVTKKRMIRVLAKRRHTWQSLFTERPDTRLKNMDERSMVRRKRSFHKVFLKGRPRKHLPGELGAWKVKKLRLDDSNENLITYEDNVENDDDTDYDQDDDKLTRPFYYTENHESEDEIEQRFAYYGSQLESEELDNGNSDNNDDQIESQNILLDKDYEKKLSEQLGFTIQD